MKDALSSGDPPPKAAASCGQDHRDHGRLGVLPKSEPQKVHILAVDDNPVVAAILAIMLKSSGHRVTSVFNAQQAIERLKSETFDLVVLDLHLPDHSGFEILEIVKKQALCPDTPIIVVSSSDEVYDISRARQLGAAGYFAKVVSPETLPDKIERILTGRDVTWMDDYHCVTAVEVPVLQHLPIDCDLWRAAFNGFESGKASLGPQLAANVGTAPRPIRQPGRAMVR
jgi:CheY-like chemotaxis protein